MTIEDVVSVIEKVGLPLALLVIILWTGSRGVWTWGRETKRERERGDKFETLALRAVGAAEGGTEVAKQLAEDHRQRTAELASAVAEALSRKDPM